MRLKSDTQTSIGNLLKRFKRRVRGIVRHGGAEADVFIFQTAYAREKRLKSVAFAIKTPCIQGTPVLEEHENRWVTKAMMSLRTEVTKLKES